MEPLVSIAWLAAHLDEPQVRLVDVRWYLGGKSGAAEYQEGHIPGAVFMDLDRELAAPASVAEGRHPLPPPETFEAAARRAGIRQETQVVVYDDVGGAVATRLWWLLRYFGHQAVAVLDGGLKAWVQAGHPVVSGIEVAATPGDFVAQPRPEMVADLDEVAARSQEEGFLLLDARDPTRYRGETEPIDSRAGHIPGARSAPFAANLSEGHFHSAEDLRARYAALGADDAETIVVYCGSGVTATHDILALEVAGYQARLFPGSWSQWSGQPALPIAVGDEGAA